MRISRRDLLLNGLLGAGSLGLRALCTGLPVAFLTDPRAARAATDADDASDETAQHLVLCTSSAGDPLNANTPGTYDFADIAHSTDPRMRPTAFSLGGRAVTAAAPWASLPAHVLTRTCFFHHRTLETGHPHLPQVLHMGATAEMLPTLVAAHLAARLGSLSAQPIALGTGEILSCNGSRLPSLPATALGTALCGDRSRLADAGALRDQTLDELRARLAGGGTRAQRSFIDQRALSRREAAARADRLLTDLGRIRSDDTDGQIAAAAALFALNVTPVVALPIDFGGDNHFDHGLRTEAEQTVRGVAHIAALLDRLASYGLADRVTFASAGVFGRTLKRHGENGRDHWPLHQTAVLIGKNVRAGVVGGLAPHAGDYAALGIDAGTGRGDDNGRGGTDFIRADETLPALGKTLCRALGVPTGRIERSIAGGRVVRAALV